MVKSVLEVPGMLRAFLAMLFGRLPMGAETLLLVLVVNERTGSFARGGAVVGVFSLCHAIASPLVGRAIDRRGPVGLLLATAGIQCAAMVAFAVMSAGAPFAVYLALAALAGATFVPLSPVMRAMWNSALDADRRHAALSLEAVVMEIVYIAGPLLFISAIGAWSLPAGLAACGVVTLIGTLAFVSAPALRAWRPEAPEPGRRGGALSDPGVRTLLVAMGLVGFSIPPLEIAISAFADERGHTGAVGLILGMWGIGSLTGGILIGRRGRPADPARRLVHLFAALAVGTAAPVLATDLWTLGALIAVAGFCIAPTFACLFGVLADVAPRGAIIEANTWLSTGIGVGIAAGAAVGGWLVESSGTTAGFVLGAAGVVVGAVVVTGREGTLRVGAVAVALVLASSAAFSSAGPE